MWYEGGAFVVKMSLFDVPSQDVLFTHIFSNLRLLDIWNLRLTSKAFHCLCWDYFMNVCNALSVTLRLPHSQDGTALGVAAAINILSKCEKIRCLEVIQGEQGFSRFLEKLLCEVIRNENVVLKRVCFRGVDFSGVSLELIDCLSIKFHELREFELCGILVGGIPIEDIIAKFIKHCKISLLKLSMTNLVSSLTRPLSLEPLTSLKHLSVSQKVTCGDDFTSIYCNSLGCKLPSGGP